MRTMWHRLVLVVLGIAGSACLGGCVTNSATGNSQLNLLSQE